MLERQLPEAYRWAREHVMQRRIPPLSEAPARCPWLLTALIAERWSPSEAPARLP
jgi:hypothetical protein